MRGWARIWSRRIMSTSFSDVPIGVRALQRCFTPSKTSYKVSVFVVTYLAYACYHMTRKPISVVKGVLQNCTKNATPETTGCRYPPFDGSDSEQLFADLDFAFLLAYAVAMFASGFIAERVSLRFFLSIGMLLSGIFCYLFGVAKTANIHSMSYFMFVQTMAGIFQTTGWPAVVSIVSRWFGKGRRGLIFGIWNSHTSIGNVLGTLLPAYYVMTDWSRSFIVPGMIMGVIGFGVYLFLVDSPEIVGCQEREVPSRPAPSDYRRLEDQGDMNDSDPDDANIIIGEQEVLSRSHISERTPILHSNAVHEHPVSSQPAIGFLKALRIPGVIDFSLCLFFTKLVAYTFLFWLPMYIIHTTTLTPEDSAKLSTTFDYGGILGAIAAGIISDYTQMPATTCSGLLLAAIPTLLMYVKWGTANIVFNYLLLFIVGLMVNGPYALITTSVCADLGRSIEGGATAMVTAIIDGTGSLGAAFGPLLAGIISKTNYNNVIYMVAISEAIAILLLVRLVRREFESLRRNERIE